MRANTAQQDRKLVNDLERQLAIPPKQWAEVLEPDTTSSFILANSCVNTQFATDHIIGVNLIAQSRCKLTKASDIMISHVVNFTNILIDNNIFIVI